MSRRLGAFCTAFLDILQFLATASFSSFLDFTDNLFLFFLCSDDGRLSFFFLFSVDDKELYSFSVDVGVKDVHDHVKSQRSTCVRRPGSGSV